MSPSACLEYSPFLQETDRPDVSAFSCLPDFPRVKRQPVSFEAGGVFMVFESKTAIITGGASGIGKALAMALLAEGTQVVLCDMNPDTLSTTAAKLNCHHVVCDVTDEDAIRSLVAETCERFGAIDIFCSNAGLARGEPDHAASADNAIWQACFDVHVMAQVYAARAVLPAMIERGEGYLLNMASAAGLLSQIGDAAYSATKHASVGFSESLAITHADDGIRVSVVCPQYVATPLTGYRDGEEAGNTPGTISADQAAKTIVEGMKRGDFMILTHPEVEGYFQNKAGDYNRWISGMRKLRKSIIEKTGSTRLEDMHKHM